MHLSEYGAFHGAQAKHVVQIQVQGVQCVDTGEQSSSPHELQP